MKRVIAFLWWWTPPAVWAAWIFLFSSRQNVSVAEEYLINFLTLKFVHMMAYAFFYLLILRALYLSQKRKITKELFTYAFIGAVAYAITDELHQTYIPTRTGTIRDVLIDTAGITLMYTVIKHQAHLLKKII